MPNPKRRHSQRRTSTRRAHDALKAPGLSECPNCHEPKLPHRVCPHCGQYKGREVGEVGPVRPAGLLSDAGLGEDGDFAAGSGDNATAVGLYSAIIDGLDDASGRCSVSNRPDQPNDSCLFTPPSKTRSTSNAISHPAARSASSETKRSGRGEPPPRPEPELRLPIFTRPNLERHPNRLNRSGLPESALI